MANEPKKSEGPACACGKADLYDEWLKLNDKMQKEETTFTPNHANNQLSYPVAAGNQHTKPVQIKK